MNIIFYNIFCSICIFFELKVATKMYSNIVTQVGINDRRGKIINVYLKDKASCKYFVSKNNFVNYNLHLRIQMCIKDKVYVSNIGWT